MARDGIVLALVALLVGCTGSENAQEPEATRSEEALFDLAAERLPNELLEEAAPTGFSVTEVHRFGPEEHRNDWVTVGARMAGPTEYARAIFYVHPNAAAARALNEQQTRLTEQTWDLLNKVRPPYTGPVPRPFEVSQDGISATCGIRSSSLLWCHAQRGRLYLLIQTYAGEFGRKSAVAERQESIARLLTRAFVDLL
ncbi:MAG: hypothetical protein ACRDLB_16985 [Actinomycetota bacterium]